MMRVCTTAQMQAIDRETIAGGVTGRELMERAGEALTEVALGMLAANGDHGHACGGGCGHDHGDQESGGVVIVCGRGNNGGDGLVMARLLEEADVPVTVLLLAAADELSADAAVNLERLPGDVVVATPPPARWAEAATELVTGCDLLVDAVFGTGINPPLRGDYPGLFRALNDVGCPCLAVDIPSGVDGTDGRVDPVAVAADVTATIGLPKRGLLLPPGRDFAGDIEVLDIGFPADVCRRHTADIHWLARRDMLALLPPRRSCGHKYCCGTVLVVAGSRTYGGAAHLAGLGALRSGAGLVALMVPMGIETSIRVGLPEAVVAGVAESAAGTLAPLDTAAFTAIQGRSDAVVLGPGLGADAETDRWITATVAALDRPLVLDADGLSAFARRETGFSFTHDRVILTPHAGELSRLTGVPSGEIADRRFELAGELAARWNAVLLLKGSPTVIGAPDGRVFVNGAGDDALARGGTGDVLAGLLGGLLAQGLGALEAALLGAYVHGRAGTLAAAGSSTRSVLVREIAAAIGPVFQEMEQEASSDADLREQIWPVGDKA